MLFYLEKTGKKIGRLIWNAIGSGLRTWKGSFKAAPFETLTLTIIGLRKALKSVTAIKIATWIKNTVSKTKSFCKAASLLTSALGGNQSATLLLTQSYPKLSKAITKTLSAFSELKSSIAKKEVFKNLNDYIKKVRNNMTGMQKGAIGVVSAFAEFVVIKDSFQDIFLGSENLAGSIAKVAAAATAAGAAMYVAFGGAGVAVAAIVGVVGAISGIKSAFDEIDAKKAGDAIHDALSSPGGTPVGELTDNVVKSIDSIGSGFSRISEKSKELDSADDKIKDTWVEIERIKTAMDAGVLSVEDGTRKLNDLFGTLAETAALKFESLELTLTAALGENGALHGYMEEVGVDTRSLMKTVLKVDDNTLAEIEKLTKEMAEIEDKTSDEYINRENRVAKLLGETDELAEALDNFDAKVKNTKVNYSGLLANDNTLDIDETKKKLGDLTTSVSGAHKDIEGAVDSIRKDLQEKLKNAIDIGDMDSATEIQMSINALGKVLDNAKGDVTKRAKSVTDALQKEFVQKTESVIKDAQKRWNEMTPFEQMLSGSGSEDEYVKKAVENYKKDYLDPLAEEIESAYGEIGEDGAGWAGDAGKKMIDNLFEEQSTGRGRDSRCITVLKKRWKDVINKSAAGVTGVAKKGG